MKVLNINIDQEREEVTIEGVCYSYALFEGLGQHGFSLNQLFKLVNRDEHTVTIERIDEDTIRADERKAMAREIHSLGVCDACYHGAGDCEPPCGDCPIQKAAGL